MKAEEIIRAGQKVGQEPGPRRVVRREFIRDFITGKESFLFAAADGDGGLYHLVEDAAGYKPPGAALFSVNEKLPERREYAIWAI